MIAYDRFPEGTVIERIDPETWRVTVPGPTEEELRHLYPLQPQTFIWSLKASWRAEAS